MSKKPFSQVKIVGCVMMHNDDAYAKLCLDSLCKYTDELYINLNEASPYIDHLCRNHPKLKKLIITDNPKGWRQGLQREKTIRMLDDVKPDIVLWPDADEVYADNLIEDLKAFWESPYDCLWFNLAYLWNSPDWMRRDGLFKSMHHVRAFKWKPGLTFLPSSGYGAKPNNLGEGQGYLFHASRPIKHYGYMTLEDRLRKYGRDGKTNYDDPKVRARMDKGIILKPVNF